MARDQVSTAVPLPATEEGSEECVESGQCTGGNENPDTADIQSELNTAYEHIHDLENKIERLQPFSETSLQSKLILHYTSLPSFHVLKAIFDFFAPTVPRAGTKLAAFQEFMVVLVKLRLNPTS